MWLPRDIRYIVDKLGAREAAIAILCAAILASIVAHWIIAALE
jgi:hypothetical protein